MAMHEVHGDRFTAAQPMDEVQLDGERDAADIEPGVRAANQSAVPAEKRPRTLANEPLGLYADLDMSLEILVWCVVHSRDLMRLQRHLQPTPHAPATFEGVWRRQ